MCITEYNEARTMTILYEEGVEEGIEIGKEEGIEIGIGQGIEIGIGQGIEKAQSANLRKIMKALGISLDEAMRMLEIPASERERYL